MRLCPLIDHGQQPMKMHTEVTLLYKYPLSKDFITEFSINLQILHFHWLSRDQSWNFYKRVVFTCSCRNATMV